MANAQPTILIVEDDEDIRESLTQLVLEAGFDVLAAENGEQALGRLREHAADIRAIVLDVEMPVMNGATFRGEQLQDPKLAAIPLIVLTARNDFAPIGKALGALACLQKPFANEALLRLLEPYR